MKSCLNCIWSRLEAVKDDGLYGYEGDCYRSEVELPPGLWDHLEDNIENLKQAVSPLLQATANDCDYYEQKVNRNKYLGDR